MLRIIHGDRSSSIASALDRLIEIIESDELKDLEGVFYIGYPLIKTPDGNKSVPALLVSETAGAIAFDVISASSDVSSEYSSERQNVIYVELEAKLKHHREILDKRNLAFKLEVVTFDPFLKVKGTLDCHLTTKDQVVAFVKSASRSSLGAKIFSALKSIVQGVSKLRTPKDRANVTLPSSKGAIMKELESQIATLDIYQNKAIIETTASPQRITGLAGTGKTVVIAGKVAYLHAIDPEMDIAITFYSRALYQQYIHLITRLYFNQVQDEPNWSKIHLLHAWGGESSPGLYYKVALANGCQPLRYDEAKSLFGYKGAWKGACDKLLKELAAPKELYDVILIDEAQDMPRSFFEICHLSTKQPKRVVWAYDELQQLSEEAILPGPEELFGTENGVPRFTFKNTEDGPDDDIILKVCYRNPKEIITTAHALGLGVYYQDGPIQMYDNEDLWTRLGYRVTGQLKPGNAIEMEREPDASPKFLEEYLSNTDIVTVHKCADLAEQAQMVAERISDDVKNGELQPSDILVIFLGQVWELTEQAAPLRAILNQLQVPSHIAGAMAADKYFKDGSVAISHIFRAKGNEAPMVYVLNTDTSASGRELIVKRNSLFTAITRARGWVRLFGVGENMNQIIHEVTEVKNNNYQLKFTFPDDIKSKRKLHGEMTLKARAKRDKGIQGLQSAIKAMQAGELQLDELPAALKEQLERLLSSKPKS